MQRLFIIAALLLLSAGSAAAQNPADLMAGYRYQATPFYMVMIEPTARFVYAADSFSPNTSWTAFFKNTATGNHLDEGSLTQKVGPDLQLVGRWDSLEHKGKKTVTQDLFIDYAHGRLGLSALLPQQAIDNRQVGLQYTLVKQSHLSKQTPIVTDQDTIMITVGEHARPIFGLTATHYGFTVFAAADKHSSYLRIARPIDKNWTSTLRLQKTGDTLTAGLSLSWSK